ncbi:MAG: tetratricopeptide repeat protein [Acidobacteriia bacterium]|nr:tetratricopeptide repeat protein [Terriglobia bacterium]
MRYLAGLVAVACFAAEPTPQALIESGHFKRARAILEPRYRANPKDPETLCLLSQLKQKWRDYATALDLAEKALAVDPKNPRYHLRVADAAGALAGKSGVFRQLSLGRRFKKEVDATLALDPNNAEALSMLMGFYVMAPGVMGGDKVKAQGIPGRIMHIDPVDGYFAQADLAWFLKQKVDLEDLFRKAVEARPASYAARIKLANYYASGSVNKFGDAEKHAREAIRIEPERAGARNVLAFVLVEEKKWVELDAALAESEKALPDNLGPYCSAAARCLWRNVEAARAEGYLRKYLSQEPEPDEATPSHAHRLLGGALHREGRNAEAIAELQTAVKLDPNSPAKEELKKIK